MAVCDLLLAVAGCAVAFSIGGFIAAFSDVGARTARPLFALWVGSFLLGVAGILLLIPSRGRPWRSALLVAGSAAAVMVAGTVEAIWQHAERDGPEDATFLIQAVLVAPVALIAVAETAYLLWLRGRRAAEQHAEPRAATDAAPKFL